MYGVSMPSLGRHELPAMKTFLEKFPPGHALLACATAFLESARPTLAEHVTGTVAAPPAASQVKESQVEG